MNPQELIRKILKEESLSDYLELNKKNLTKVIKNLRRTYGCSTENINKGFCDDFAVEVANHFFDADTVETLFFRQLNGLSLVIYTEFETYDDEFEPHTWIIYNGRHYDAETPNGVVSHLNLPIYKRQFENTKKINESKFFRRRIDLDEVKWLLPVNAKQIFHETESFKQFKYELTLRAVESIMWNEYNVGWEDLPEQEEIDFVTEVADIFEDIIIDLYKHIRGNYNRFNWKI